MRWKQFFTPAKSMNADDARDFMAGQSSDDFVVLDVRQPTEYEEGHIPGAKLIPLPDLDSRLDEIDPEKSTIVYCALGGRSRVAAQMLSDKGFSVIDLMGGFKGWNGDSAIGRVDHGLELFSGNESPEHTLAVAYSLEEGLRDFYMTMAVKVIDLQAKALFKKLSEIEVKHQECIYNEYLGVAEQALSREEFVFNHVNAAMEGGLTTEEYTEMFKPDWESARDITGIAMSIEAQALDLYQRASDRIGDEKSRKALLKLADEERMHLKQLGELIEAL